MSLAIAGYLLIVAFGLVLALRGVNEWIAGRKNATNLSSETKPATFSDLDIFLARGKLDDQELDTPMAGVTWAVCIVLVLVGVALVVADWIW